MAFIWHMVAFILVYGGSVSGIIASRVVLEVEDVFFKEYRVMKRTAASGGKSFHAYKGDTVHIEFCLAMDTAVVINDIRYSNDGPGDRIKVDLDSQFLGEFRGDKIDRYGKGWNDFHSTGPINSPSMVGEGRHRLSLTTVDSDRLGMEFDMVEIEIQNNQSEATVKCDVFCFDEIQYTDDLPFKSNAIGKGRIEQKSQLTKCAEEDNVHIPIFHSSARRYIVSASHPRYTTFSNSRLPDFTNCKIPQHIWKFEDFQFFAFVKDIFNRKLKSAVLTAENDRLQSYVEVDFSLLGPSAFSADSEIGSYFELVLENQNMNVTVSISYYGRYNTWFNLNSVELGPSRLWASWNIKDYSWKEGDDNKLKIVFDKETVGDINVKYIKLSKREIKEDESSTLFEDGMTAVDAVRMDMWWKTNQSMSVMLSSDPEAYNNTVHYLRIYRRIPWSRDSLSQIFVIYQDGYVRVLPPTPHGVDWVPFGSSILLGQSSTSSPRPSAPIKHIHLNPVTLEMKILYEDNGTTTMQIKTTLRETQLFISHSKFMRDLNNHPFITFRSMWVSDGNSDADHVTVDGKHTKAIMGQWRSMEGTFFAFFRKCISKHNTLSPDIRLKIIE